MGSLRRKLWWFRGAWSILLFNNVNSQLLSRITLEGDMVKRLFVVVMVLCLSACGWQLRGAASLPFQSVFVAIPEHTEIGREIRRTLKVNGVRVTERPDEAQVVLSQVLERRERDVLSISGTGQVREFRLVFHYAYQLTTPKNIQLAPQESISVSRDMTFDATTVHAKGQEEEFLWNDMQQDVVQQMLRRLAVMRLDIPGTPVDTYNTSAQTGR